MLLSKILLLALLFCAASSVPQFAAYKAPPPPPISTGVAFNTSFGDFMVLQQSPAKACVYGTIGAGGMGATVKLESSDDELTTSYEVNATIIDAPTPGFKLWKACLKPQATGGEFKATATCTGCTNTTDDTLTNVVFGDVYYCSGQSNSKLTITMFFIILP
jgi:hypothetical protein